ncbi:MAG: ATP-dependent zinc protease [Flavobacteriales bacterium]|nr:ATP-dependent zinc protease [Flavobacteriales bacterium]MCB9448758.1 ATP-dependent zinc protease [Flavobacteriales bacterium]
MKKIRKPKPVIGRKDRIDLPELKLEDLDAKVDTGAYTSALHCHNLTVIDRDGAEWVRFNLLDPEHPQYNEKAYCLPVHTRRVIKNSFGTSEERITIITKVIVFGKEYPLEMSLSNRSDLKYPVLLGRKFLRSRFVVDVNKTLLSFRKKTTDI